MIRKTKAGNWQVDIQPGGRGKRRIRKTFPSKAEAKRFEAYAMSKVPTGEWNPKRDDRSLRSLIDAWYQAHGVTLKDGENRYHKLKTVCDRLQNPTAARFSATDFARYRMARMEQDGVTANTVNREHAYLKAVFNELIRLGEWSADNPMTRIKTLSIDEPELAFLTEQQINDLLESCKQSGNPSVYPVTRLALATGARWSEAENVTESSFTPYRVTFNYTKSGKSRHVPLRPDLYAELVDELPFESCSGAFRSALKRAGLDLPKGQLTHICRHTFASHFMMNGGDILTLQRILGHSDIKLTMRYAHLSPDHLAESVMFGPRLP